MKKLVFTIQVIILLAMIPVYVIVELNHKKEKAAAVYLASGIEEGIEIKNIK